MDIDSWLRGIGLEQYAQTFRDNAIDADVLCDLTDEHLRELGLPLGARLKLLRAVAALSTGQTPICPEITTPAPRTDAERRQVTVMFSDLVGSTALSARIDPEDLREVISAYQKCVSETIGRFCGFVAKYMGDGVLIYFGFPQAHEDDAERAVRAGLELVAAVSGLKTHAALQTRVGIATGLVVVGDLIGSGASQEQAIVGETPNLAARLQGVAEPNSVVIAESTRKLVGNLFELEDLGAQDLKGIAGPVQAWAALRPASVESRFEAFHPSGLTELVGREEEIALLLRRWSKAKAGEGQVMLLSGEAGIGKSRLTAALLERLAIEPHTRLRYFCSPQHTDSAFYPIISQMERAAAFTHDDTAQAKLDKLDALLARSLTPHEDASLLAEMLALPNDGRYPELELAPQERRQKTLATLTAQIEALSRSNPVLMIFEDVHWIDPTSLEALGRTVDRLRTLGVLLIVTYRPEFEAPWIGRPHVTTLNLNRLGEREIAALIDRVTGNNSLPASVRHDIIERTDGIPLFIEEMTKAVMEAESEGDARRTAAAVPSSALVVPASLHASLMARLDRLGAAKELAQIGAGIGREFSHVLLAAVAGKPEQVTAAELEHIVAAGLLFRQGHPPNATYLFKHALVQDAAYGTLLREHRRTLHARIGDTLQRQFPEIAENRPELLARHFTEAMHIEKAAALWGKAGQRSLNRSALLEAIVQLTRALDQITTLPGTLERLREQIKLQVALTNALMHVKGHASSDSRTSLAKAQQYIEQAETLGEPLEDPLLLFSVLYGFWIANFMAFDGNVLKDLASQFLASAEKQSATAPLMMAHRIMGMCLLYCGDVAEGKAHLDRAILLYDPDKHRQLATRFVVDAGPTILSYRSLALCVLGYPDAALIDADRALSIAKQTGHTATLIVALLFGAMVNMFRGNYALAKLQANELIALSEQSGALFWKQSGMHLQGSIFAMTGKAVEAVALISPRITEAEATGTTIGLPRYLTHLARSHAELGQFYDASCCIGRAMAPLEKANERWEEAEVYRVAGEIALISSAPDPPQAEAYFERALAVARRQQAKFWELRAAMSLARLRRDQGKPQQARELLAPVYGWFSEGFDTRDLKDAKTLLEDLVPPRGDGAIAQY